MKILLTGCTPKQVRPQPEFQYFSFFQAFLDCLESLGHEVDWRHVKAGEDLSDYDFALVGLHCLGSNAAKRYKYGALWAASQLPHLPVIQDWRVKQICQTIRATLYVWKCDHLDDSTYDNWYRPAKENRAHIEAVRYQWEHHFEKVIVPMFEWADPDGFQRCGHDANQVLKWNPDSWYDPARWYPERTVILNGRRREWTLASLSPQEEWLELHELSWPVHDVFARRDTRSIGGMRKKGQFWQLTPEPEVVRDHYLQEWGVLLPYYGTETPPGWWRGRFKLSAWCGTVLGMDTRDQGPPSTTCAYEHDLQEIEEMSEVELEELALRQFVAHQDWEVSPTEMADRLQSYIDDPCPPITP